MFFSLSLIQIVYLKFKIVELKMKLFLWIIFTSICYYIGLILLFSSIFCIYQRYIFYISIFSLFVEYDILTFNSSSIIIVFLLDWISLSFMGVVILISSIVIIYSYRYISGDKDINKFIFLVYLFVLSIILLITSPNIIRILLGWDGLGLVSYCLVIYYQNIKSANAGILTVLSNRIGDVAILLRISWILNFGSCNFFFLQHIFYDYYILLIFILVFVARMTKRAQIPFSAWLPAAMAAPTPVSSLVHSSTLVTAGVYLLIRFHNVLEYNYILFVISVLTIIISGLGANFETDLKKVIALSTLSQLGVIIIILSIGYFELAFLHLLSHALFKSLLFLCAGFFIHRIGDIQDVRLIGSISLFSPIISIFFFCSSISLCGFPFISGFYSKDLIIEIILMSDLNFIIFVILFVSTMFTLIYSVRLIYYLCLFFLTKRSFFVSDDYLIFFPISLLFLISIIGGSLFIWLYFPCYFVYISFFIKFLILFSLTTVFFLVTFFSSSSLTTLITVNKCFYFLRNIWNLPLISTYFFIKVLSSGTSYIKYFDQGWLELLGAQGIYSKLNKNSYTLDVSIFLNIKNYLLLFFFITVLFFIFVYLNSLNLKHSVEVTKIVFYF